MQTVLTKLRRLHEEVCHCWRKQSEPHISEGEAEVINLGFMILEAAMDEVEMGLISVNDEPHVIIRLIGRYVDRVHAQFADNSEIKTPEV